MSFSSRAAVAALSLLLLGCERGKAIPDAPAPPTSPADAPEVLLRPSIVEVAPGIRLLGATFPNACYVIETSAGLALVDTCAEADAAPVLDQLRAAGLDPARVRWILLTHAHGDHSLGARKLRELTGARVHAGRGDSGVLRAGAPREAFFSVFEMPMEAHATPVDVELAGDEVLELGDDRIRVIATPGHTPGSVCYLLERGGRRLLFTGDVVTSLTDTVPLAGPGIYSAALSPRFRGDAVAYAASLRKLLAMPAPDLVLPGHPRADPVPQNPRLPRAQWEGLLTRAIAKLDTLVVRHRRDGADFLDGDPKELLEGLNYWGDAGGHAVYALVARSDRLILFGVPDVPDPASFLKQRCEESGLHAMTPEAVVLTSAASRETSGLSRLVEATGCTVVAPRAGLEVVRGLCPPDAKIRASEELPDVPWFPVEVFAVDAPDGPSVAYLLRWKGKVVVVPGRFPVPLPTRESAQAFRALFSAQTDLSAYLRSLERLERLPADLWLPFAPFQDQNANVYDDDWAAAVRSNRLVTRE